MGSDLHMSDLHNWGYEGYKYALQLKALVEAIEEAMDAGSGDYRKADKVVRNLQYSKKLLEDFDD